MRVLMLNYEYPPLGGGAANATRYLLREFSERPELTVDLVTSSPGGYREESPSATVDRYRLDVSKRDRHYWRQSEIARYAWKAYRKCRELEATREYDLVHAWFGVPSGVVARLLEPPALVALRGSDVPGYNDRFAAQYVLLKPLIRRVWRDAAAVVANSRGLRELALETADVPIDVIPNGVAVEEFEPVYHERDRLRVLCVSRLIARKGLGALVDAVAELAARGGLDVELTIVGEGELAGSLRTRAERRGVADRVTFAGYVPHDEIHRYYEAADVFALPSHNEGMSNTILEAMAAGLPIVTSDTGGTAELLGDNGIVVRAGDPTSIATALETYAADRDLLGRHGRESRSIAEEMSWTAVADRYLETYDEICDGRKRSRESLARP